jgi:hypothetical protein
MKVKITRSHLILSSFVAGMALVATIFQNCGAQDYTNSLVQPSASKVDATHIDRIPFAFDFQANQLSYMSCSRSNDKSSTGTETSPTHLSDPNVFYTFKIGAYDNSIPNSAYANANLPTFASGGLTVRQEFIDYVNENFTFKEELSDQEIQDAFTYGTAHGGAALQFAIRQSTPIANQIQFIGSSQTPTQGISYQLFPQNVLLTFKEFLPQLISLFKDPSIRLTRLGASTLQSYNLEAALHEESLSPYNELTADVYRRNLESSAATLSTLLAVTYSLDLRLAQNTTDMYVARSSNSATSDNRVWGSGFKMTFGADSRMTRKKSVVSAATEYDLSSFEPTGSNWQCPQSFRYIIVSPQDRDSVYPCMERNENSLNAVQRADLLLMRRHLPQSEWIIDPLQQCVSPKKSNLDCYGNRAFNPVIYDNSTECGLNSNNMYLHKDCAEFVSFCFRK